MLTSSNTPAQSLQQPPAQPTLQLPPGVLPWADWLDELASMLEANHAGNDRAFFVAAIIRDSATVAHLHRLDSPLSHHRWNMECDEDYDPEPEPDNGPAAPTAGGIGWGLDDQWDLRNL